MRLRTDERGVTVQIGTVMLFAVLIVLLSIYQASVVPQQNEQVEFNHNQQVQSQMQDLRDELLRTAATGSGGSASVALGTQYPVRAFFVNPSSPSGSLRTTSSAELRLDSAKATGETGDYWTGSVREFDTRGVVYEPNYNVYQNPPTTVYRNGVLYNRFDGANRIVAGQQLVRGNTISLVAVTGDLSTASSGTASVNLRPVSPATRTVTVRNETDEEITLVVPTELSVTEWEGLLESELDADENDPEKHVTAVESAGANAVRIVLEPGVYELRLARVGVGTGMTGTEAHYVTDVRGDDESVAENTTQKLVVEVRDRYNNPVTGARVNLSLRSDEPDDTLVHLGESKDAFSNLRTDSQGQVEVQYDAAEFNGNTREEDVEVSIEDVPNADFDPGAKENLTFDLRVYNVGGPGNGGGGDGGGGGGNSPGNDPPTITSMDVTDESEPERGQNAEKVEYDVSWSASDPEGNVRDVTVTVKNTDTGDETVYTDQPADGSITFQEADKGTYDDTFEIEVVATDNNGQQACKQGTGPANGNDDEEIESC